jgi:hypothetical protein
LYRKYSDSRPFLSHYESIDSFHYDGEAVVFRLCYPQIHHDVLQRRYQGNYIPIRAAFVWRWLYFLPQLFDGSGL